MILSISAVLLFGAGTAFAIRAKSTSFGAAIVVFLFGFYAAATGAAEPITEIVTATAHAIGSMRG
ncbi:hypothetical protein OG896_29490 [Streptomyces sp. NBC_00669]|uniref:hypothetical protein n=1 Tax=Streptomyces sp. NBC_00669 TaxID=2976011 RepID=UPI002E30DF84|nr:hypothetical protein [Streptomyces sp. NBC_00669]